MSDVANTGCTCVCQECVRTWNHETMSVDCYIHFSGSQNLSAWWHSFQYLFLAAPFPLLSVDFHLWKWEKIYFLSLRKDSSPVSSLCLIPSWNTLYYFQSICQIAVLIDTCPRRRISGRNCGSWGTHAGAGEEQGRERHGRSIINWLQRPFASCLCCCLP